MTRAVLFLTVGVLFLMFAACVCPAPATEEPAAEKENENQAEKEKKQEKEKEKKQEKSASNEKKPPAKEEKPASNDKDKDKEQPPKKSDSDQDTQKGLDGLGFSSEPKEGGKARVKLFGLIGEGYKFVYVFDRSGSMGGEGRQSLRAVKAELIRSLDGLDTVHQFQIIFYNQRPTLFNPSGQTGRLAFGTEENKRAVIDFLDTIKAVGGTDHEQALRAAIRLHPDVIFFLTDADDPKLNGAQLKKIQDLAAGIVIHATEFGPGPKPAGDSFLAALAGQNGGGYAYIDISKRAAEEKKNEQ
jgi:hypothetical protein